MKIKLAIVFLLIMVFLSACSAKKVPDTVILRDLNTVQYTSYKFEHSYDKDAHIDDVQITLYDKGEYGTEITKFIMPYQYDKASDLWKKTQEYLLCLLDAEHSVEWNCDAIIEKSPWVGELDTYSDVSYSITIKSVDLKNMVAVVEYRIEYESEYKEDISKTAEFELEEGNQTLWFEIVTGEDWGAAKLRVSFDAHKGVRVIRVY
jgi:hypothetical protein